MDCPLYKENLKYDIEHIDEIKDVTYRCLLKNKLGIPRTEQDNKELQEFQDVVNHCLNMSADKILCSGMYDEVYNKKFMNKLKKGKLYKRW
jgi:hypothetical protein